MTHEERLKRANDVRQGIEDDVVIAEREVYLSVELSKSKAAESSTDK